MVVTGIRQEDGPRAGQRARCRAAALAGAAVVALALGACAPTGEPGPNDPTSDASGTGTPITIGLTYVPNVQFAPFYLAESAGYFAEAGLDVTLRHHGEGEDLLGALVQGDEDVVVAGGDEMLQGRSQEVPVVSIATLYASYPVVLIVPADSPIESPADLTGHTIGVPGPYGETWFGLLAMLNSAGLSQADVTIENIGYTQQAALSAGHVDAVMGFANNDVPQFEAAGLDVRAVEIGDAPLVGISIGTTDELVDAQGDALAGVITAVGQAVADIVADPQAAVDASAEHIPGTLTADQEVIMLATVKQTVPLYGEPGPDWGTQDEARWSQMADFMLANDLIAGPVSSTEAFTNSLISGR